MANSRLTAVSVERFKSHREEAKIATGGLTVLIGKNNSGKSSIVQALLLLKQTLEFPKLDVPLHLDGVVEALSLRELTFGWPDGDRIKGPTFRLRWKTSVDVAQAVDRLANESIEVMLSNTGLKWLTGFNQHDFYEVESELMLSYSESKAGIQLSTIELRSLDDQGGSKLAVKFDLLDDGEYDSVWNGIPVDKIEVNLDHFIPYVSLNKRSLGPRAKQRGLVNAFNVVFLQPLDDLRELIKAFGFLSSVRAFQPHLFRFGSSSLDTIGYAAESAAQLLQAQKDAFVRYISPANLDGERLPESQAQNLADSVRDVLGFLGVEQPLSIDEMRDVGFRLRFGGANLQHVGRGLTYLLPIVELGLISDPYLFRMRPDSKFEPHMASVALCAFEEPEAHLNPRVQAKLAEWFVSLAMSGRQIFVETHSDHMVRRLRQLVATSKSGSDFEQWLLNEVAIVEVEQTAGVSSVRSSRLERSGALERWPAEFMEQAILAEEEIYVAAIKKRQPSLPPTGMYVHHEGDEP